MSAASDPGPPQVGGFDPPGLLRLMELSMDRAPDAILWLRRDGGTAYVNDAACRLLGYSRDELLRRDARSGGIAPIGETWSSVWDRVRTLGTLELETNFVTKAAVLVAVELRLNYLAMEGCELVSLHACDLTAHRQSQQALKAACARLATVFDGARDAIFVADAGSGVILEANDEAARLVNRTKADLVGMHQTQLHPSDQRDRYRSQFQRRTKEENLQCVDGEIVTSDGRRVPVEISSRTVELAEGRAAMIGIFRDVTDRACAERRNHQESRCTGLLLGLHKNAERMGDRELIDHVLAEAVGLTGSDVGFLHVVSDDQDSLLLTAWSGRAIGHGRAPFDARKPLRAAADWGEYLHKRCSVVSNAPGWPEVDRFMCAPVVEGDLVRIILGVANKPEAYQDHDVGQLQLVANELHGIMRHRAASKRLRLHALLLDQIADGVTATDMDGRIIYVNEAQARMIQQPLASLIGASVEAFNNDPTRGLTQREIIARTRSEGTWHGEVVNRRANGEDLVADVRTAVVRDEAGQPIGLIGVATDATERRRAEDDLRRRHEELKRFNEAMVGRELRMIELKQEINALCARLGEAPRYGIDPGSEPEAADPAGTP